MTIKFFIVAFIVYPWTTTAPDMKLNKNYMFDTITECEYALRVIGKPLREGLETAFPNGSGYSIKCLDNLTIDNLREKYGYERQES
tara:strand:+ start:1141 stop:1398 length:258 start_codon:yes stop_codon:yes gene_type:complete